MQGQESRYHCSKLIKIYTSITAGLATCGLAVYNISLFISNARHTSDHEYTYNIPLQEMMIFGGFLSSTTTLYALRYYNACKRSSTENPDLEAQNVPPDNNYPSTQVDSNNTSTPFLESSPML